MCASVAFAGPSYGTAREGVSRGLTDTSFQMRSPRRPRQVLHPTDGRSAASVRSASRWASAVSKRGPGAGGGEQLDLQLFRSMAQVLRP